MDVAAVAGQIADKVAAPAATAVDLEGRFPSEAIAALRTERLLGALVPQSLGGLGASIAEVAEACELLGRRCANTAMIYAMHQIQVHCLLRHGLSFPQLRQFLVELCDRQLLLASATTETHVGGDIRASLCAVIAEGERFSLEKSAAVVSYGAQADGVLVTARRGPEAASNDQVIVLGLRDAMTLEPIGTWDTLGFRGTCSVGYFLRVTGPAAHVLPEPFADISAHTMVPTSHVLWTSLWLGIATDAVNRARACIRSEARRRPGVTPAGAHRLAEVVSDLQMMRATVHEAVRDYTRCMDDREALSSMGFALRMNNLKISGARLVVAIVAGAMQVTGISGYRRDSSYSVERHLRDAYGAGLMINTDRVCDANAAMLLVAKDA